MNPYDLLVTASGSPESRRALRELSHDCEVFAASLVLWAEERLHPGCEICRGAFDAWSARLLSEEECERETLILQAEIESHEA